MEDNDIIRFNVATTLLGILNHNDEDATEDILARYLLENMSRLDKLSIYTIANDCYTSRSTVQRFIKQIGYGSYTELKAACRNYFDEHAHTFASYTDRTQFADYLAEELSAMARDVNAVARQQDISWLARRMREARAILFLTAEDSSSAVRVLQQAMLGTGRLMRLMTSSTQSMESLKLLGRKDLLIVCSATGNFALTIADYIRAADAQRVLVTNNHTASFEGDYTRIFYLGERHPLQSRNIQSNRSVYTHYAVQYFLDLLFHEYFLLEGGTPARQRTAAANKTI